MSVKCPYVLQVSEKLNIPPIPTDMLADIPFAPQPYSGVDYQMAGTKNTINYNPNKKYSVEPPRKQNTLNVCSITKNNSKDFNSGKRKCYKIYSSEQNVTGDICSSIGTDGPEYSTDKGIIDGNSNWKRGNTFGANFSNDVNNRVIYKYMQPYIKENNKKVVYRSQFYPVRDLTKNHKEYPEFKEYTKNGYPTWRPSYKMNENILKNSSNIKLLENFCNKSPTNKFWTGISLIIISIILTGNY